MIRKLDDDGRVCYMACSDDTVKAGACICQNRIKLLEQVGKMDNFEIAKINISVESDLGLWELFRIAGSDKYTLQKWGEDSDYPLVELNLTIDEFKDLETLFGNIEKYGSID
jgi:hypothetical protein